MTRTYYVIPNGSPIPIGTCQQILANKMLCWKPGAVLISETEGEGPEAKTTQYQLCRTHAIILEAAEKQAAQQQEFTEEALRNKMLGVQMVKEQTAAPQGEDSSNNQ